ncbi:MAG TPA: hypothetical protein VKR59_11960, partial [Terriglobales bacterium]|nr:hypothetical protein [Terriglobales bacterium]
PLRRLPNHTGGVAQDRSARDKKRRRQRMFAWWYLCVGIAFILLAIRSLIRGDQLWTIGLRFVVAAGFFVLSAGTLRTTR